MSNKSLLTMLVFLISFSLTDCQNKDQIQSVNIIPKPVSMTVDKGTFKISERTELYYDAGNKELARVAGIFRDNIREHTGKDISVSSVKGGKGNVILEILPDLKLPDESYKMSVSPDQIKISAPKVQGVFYGLQSLTQLIICSASGSTSIPIPCVEITDYPRFSWRGMMLDVSRHFFTADSVKRFIDFLALYKYNRFHWHLTDDQGWRIEIKKYPKLTTIGAWRKLKYEEIENKDPSLVSDSLYGGYYTQEQIWDIVRYASDRYITVIPEIEMPGHSQAAIVAYPELGVTGKQLEIETNWKKRHISANILDPNKKTLKFYEDVLDEVIRLFPSSYIHLGGDEARKDQWKASEAVQAQIKRLELKNEDELQSWFIRQIEKHLIEKGRRLIGWDEILEGGLAPEATVMSWRGNEGGIKAAQMGHDVIMAPNKIVYFNYRQTDSTTNMEQVYTYDPVPPELKKEEVKFVMGAEGCMWTTYVSTLKEVEYMVFPRITALSEALWTDDERYARDYTEFMERLKRHRVLFKKLNINYCRAEID